MDFHALPASPDDPRYLKRAKSITSLLKAKQERLVEDGMLMDRFTAEDDFYWFITRFTSWADPELRNPGASRKGYRITERGHPLRGKLWGQHPFSFWYARELQRILAEPPDGPVWVKMHRIGHKTTQLLMFVAWLHARDEMDTVALWTHSVEKIGNNMGRGVLENIQSEALGTHWPQFARLREGRNLGYLLDRPEGPRDQSFSVFSILGSIESIHPNWYLLDDVVTQALRGNVKQIAKVSGVISAIAAAMPPDATMICANTPWDESDPLMQRESEGWFGRIIEQWATEGGRILERVNGVMKEVSPGFTRRGEANLHTMAYFAGQRAKINDDSIYFPQYDGKFYKSPTVLFDWSKLRHYHESPEVIAKASPHLNIIVDAAGGGQDADFMVIRVMTWTANDCWATLDLIRERVGATVAMQLLLGRDDTDARTEWIPTVYPRYRTAGIVEYWMAFDPTLTIWFDDKTGWVSSFNEHVRLRRVTFGGKRPKVKAWPEVHVSYGGKGERTKSWTKETLIRRLETPYAQGKAAYPAYDADRPPGQRGGFGHGSRFGLTGSPDDRDTVEQFRQDEFSRMELGGLPPFDDMLDTERLFIMEKALAEMSRPSASGGYRFGDDERPGAITMENPWGRMRPRYYPGQRTNETWMHLG